MLAQTMYSARGSLHYYYIYEGVCRALLRLTAWNYQFLKLLGILLIRVKGGGDGSTCIFARVRSQWN